jgi:hypothetical protein
MGPGALEADEQLNPHILSGRKRKVTRESPPRSSGYFAHLPQWGRMAWFVIVLFSTWIIVGVMALGDRCLPSTGSGNVLLGAAS